LANPVVIHLAYIKAVKVTSIAKLQKKLLFPESATADKIPTLSLHISGKIKYGENPLSL